MKKAEITTPSATNSLPYDRSPCRDPRRELWNWPSQDHEYFVVYHQAIWSG